MNWTISESSDNTWLLKGSNAYLHFVDSVDNLPKVSYQNMLFDLTKWDQYWQQDSCNFVPANLADLPRTCCENDQDYLAEQAMHRQKIQRWANELGLNSENEMVTGKVPAVCFSETLVNGQLRIRQGRHRIAYLRQIGAPCFAAAIPVEQVQFALNNHFIFKGLVTQGTSD